MARFLVDEDLSRSTAVALRRSGLTADDVRDVGLRGHSDDDVFDFAQRLRAVLVTADTDFANALRFPPGSHHGIVVLRLPNYLRTDETNAVLLRALAGLTDDDLIGSLVIVQTDRIRIRRRPREDSGADNC